MVSEHTDIAILSSRPRRFSWLGRSVLGGPDPLRIQARALATDLGWFVTTARRKPELLDAFEAFVLFDSIGPEGLRRQDISFFRRIGRVSILCPVPEDITAMTAVVPGHVTVVSTPPALVYFPLMLPDFDLLLPSWAPQAPARFLMVGRVRRDFRLIGTIQHALPAPVDVVTDMAKVDLRVEANLTIHDFMEFSKLCGMAASSRGLLVLVERAQRAGLATVALGLALGMPVVASSVPGIEAIAHKIEPDIGLALVNPGDGGQVLSALRRLLADERWTKELAKNAVGLSAILEREARDQAILALESIGL